MSNEHLNMGVIYKIVAPNGKVYVGQTIHNVERRWKEHIIDANDARKDHCKLLNRSIRKYGSDNFSIEVIEMCDNSKLNQRETYYIHTLSTLKPNGLNLKLGGSNGSHIDETKQKISNALKGCEVPESRRLKLSKTKKNNDLPMYLIHVKHNNEIIGYRVCNHPIGGEKKFTNKREKNLSKLYDSAICHLFFLNSLTSHLKQHGQQVVNYIKVTSKGIYFKHGDLLAEVQIANPSDISEICNKVVQELQNKVMVQRLDGSG